MKAIAYVAAIVLMLVSPVNAEDMLEKGTTRFLGWHTSPTAFTTCDKTVLPIETGKVVKTLAKCQGVVFALSDTKVLTVRTVDASSRTLGMMDDKGTAWSVFYPVVAEKPEAVRFELIKPGQKFDVELIERGYTKQGTIRAESITELNRLLNKN